MSFLGCFYGREIGPNPTLLKIEVHPIFYKVEKDFFSKKKVGIYGFYMPNKLINFNHHLGQTWNKNFCQEIFHNFSWRSLEKSFIFTGHLRRSLKVKCKKHFSRILLGFFLPRK